MYLSDLQDPITQPEWGPVASAAGVAPQSDSLRHEGPQNIMGNNCRIMINDAINVNAPGGFPPLWSLFAAPQAAAFLAAKEALRLAQGEEEVVELKFEFAGSDDTFENVKYSDYPKLLTAFQDYDSAYPPQLILLQELIEKENPNLTVDLATLEDLYNSVNNQILETLRLSVLADNQNAFEYGAGFDDLSSEDFEYVMPYDTEQTTPVPYEYDRADKTLGISRNQWEAQASGHPEDTRVFYLNPLVHGGTKRFPRIYVKAQKNKGWMGFIDAIFPDFSECPDANTDIVNFGPVKDRVNESYNRIPEDQRLKQPPDCVVELPYNRILERPSKAALEALITATLQIFISTHLLKSMPIITYFKPSFPENYSKIYVGYIIEVLEAALKDAQGPLREFFNTFKDNEFWYAFLEQSVQLYGRLADDGVVPPPSPRIKQITTRLNSMQTVYKYPTKEDLRAAIKLGEEPWYQIFNLPGYRSEKNLEAVQATEEDAKLILSELVEREINLMADKIATNLKDIDADPTFDKLAYWFLSESGLVAHAPDLAAQTLHLRGTLVASIEDADLDKNRTEPFYTSGGELFVDGEDYVGYYHINRNEQNEMVFMAGKQHIEGPHDVLSPYVSKIKMKDGEGNLMGDIADFGTASSAGRFAIEKYISIEGVKKSSTEAVAEIQDSSHDPQSNLSDYYPGDLEILEEGGAYREEVMARIAETTGNPVGLKGHLGVRHGLQFYCVMDGVKVPITSVEIDALDTAIGDFTPAESSTKLLLCLLEKLLEEEKFRMITEFIYPLNKYTALSAIYTDLALFPSIGEKIFDPTEVDYSSLDGDADGSGGSAAAGNDAVGWLSKAGLHFDTKAYTEEAGYGSNNIDTSEIDVASLYYDNPGWNPYTGTLGLRRPGPLSWLVGITKWDSWDQVILRKSKNRIKQLFKTYYYSRDFKPGDPLTEERPSKSRVRTLKSFYVMQPGAAVVSPSQRRRLSPNPFGPANGECKKADE